MPAMGFVSVPQKLNCQIKTIKKSFFICAHIAKARLMKNNPVEFMCWSKLWSKILHHSNPTATQQ
jgi:hypothetical protein